MLSIRPNPYQPPTRFRYRFTRFLLSKTFWFFTRILLPLGLVAIIFYQLWTSQNLRNYFAEQRQSVVEYVAFLPMFELKSIEIENGTRLNQAEILGVLDIEMPNSSLLLDRDMILERLQGYDAIGEAAIRFSRGGVVKVILKPRVPAMIYLSEEGLISIDETGHRVQPIPSRAEHPELFVISGEGATEVMPEAQVLIKMIMPFADRVRGLVRMGERRWDIVLINGGRLMLPTEQPQQALRLILVQHQEFDVLNRDILAYDMRDPARPILRLGEDAQNELRRLKMDIGGQGA